MMLRRFLGNTMRRICIHYCANPYPTSHLLRPAVYEDWELDKADVISLGTTGDIVIGNDVWIGWAVIMASVHIGDGAIVGTRAVVTKMCLYH